MKKTITKKTENPIEAQNDSSVNISRRNALKRIAALTGAAGLAILGGIAISPGCKEQSTGPDYYSCSSYTDYDRHASYLTYKQYWNYGKYNSC